MSEKLQQLDTSKLTPVERDVQRGPNVSEKPTSFLRGTAPQIGAQPSSDALDQLSPFALTRGTAVKSLADQMPNTTTNTNVTNNNITQQVIGSASSSPSWNPKRMSIEFTTPSLAANAVTTGVVNLGKTFNLLSVRVNAACRIRLYSSSAALAADASRGLVAPSPYTSHGIITDLALTDTSKFVPDTMTPSSTLMIYNTANNQSSQVGCSKGVRLYGTNQVLWFQNVTSFVHGTRLQDGYNSGIYNYANGASGGGSYQTLIDSDGYVYAAGSSSAHFVKWSIENIATDGLAWTTGGTYPYTLGDFLGRKFLFINASDVNTGPCGVNVWNRVNHTLYYILPMVASDQTNGGAMNIAFDSTTGNVIALMKTVTSAIDGHWKYYLSYCYTVQTGIAPPVATITQIGSYLDAAVPMSMTYNPNEQCAIILYSDSSLRKFSLASASFVSTVSPIVSPYTVYTDALTDTGKSGILMAFATGNPASWSTVRADGGFFIAGTKPNGGTYDEIIYDIDAATLQVRNLYNITQKFPLPSFPVFPIGDAQYDPGSSTLYLTPQNVSVNYYPGQSKGISLQFYGVQRTFPLSPEAVGSDLNTSPTGAINFSVQNLSGVTQPIDVTFTVLKDEV